MAEGWRPHYPFSRKVGRSHNLALWVDRSLRFLDDNGEWIDLDCPEYPVFVHWALEYKLDVRVENVLYWPFFDHAVADSRAKVHAAHNRSDQEGTARAVSITWREGNRWSSLFSAQSWGDGATEDTVHLHRELCATLGVGTYASPGALGQATIRRYLGASVYPLSTLCLAARSDLYEHLYGGRAEWSGACWLDTASEQDRTMAYTAESRSPLPVGAARASLTLDLDKLNRQPAWWGECVVYVHRPLALGPFPVRSAHGWLRFPTHPGTYETWLWGPEVRDCLDAGCSVVARKAWTWPAVEPVLQPWAEWIGALRRQTTDTRLAAAIKKVAVAGIGWFAMRPEHLTITEESDGTGPLIVNQSEFPTRYGCRRELDLGSTSMPHWASYIWMLARRTLYARQRSELSDGNRVLWSNFDNLVTLRPTRQPTSVQLGEWRTQTLTNVMISASRTMLCDQKTTLPGQTGETRGNAIAEWLKLREQREAYQALWKAEHPLEYQAEVIRLRKRSGSTITLDCPDAGYFWGKRK